jgi:hypothetical protein
MHSWWRFQKKQSELHGARQMSRPIDVMILSRLDTVRASI